MRELLYQCERCGKMVKEEDTICPKCGFVFEDEEEEVKEEKDIFVCQNCDKEVDGDATQCPYCGISFDEEDDETYEEDDDENDENLLHLIKGNRGRTIKIYKDRVTIKVKLTIGSFLTQNVTDGEKTIFYKDVIGVQFKPCKLAIGYLQFETAAGVMNNEKSNFFNENTFTFEPPSVSNESMRKIYNEVLGYISEYKSNVLEKSCALINYKKLLDEGVITKSEFNKVKSELL